MKDRREDLPISVILTLENWQSKKAGGQGSHTAWDTVCAENWPFKKRGKANHASRNCEVEPALPIIRVLMSAGSCSHAARILTTITTVTLPSMSREPIRTGLNRPTGRPRASRGGRWPRKPTSAPRAVRSSSRLRLQRVLRPERLGRSRSPHPTNRVAVLERFQDEGLNGRTSVVLFGPS